MESVPHRQKDRASSPGDVFSVRKFFTLDQQMLRSITMEDEHAGSAKGLSPQVIWLNQSTYFNRENDC